MHASPRRRVLLAQLPIPPLGPGPLRGNVPLAGAYLKEVAPHLWGSALLFSAGLHLAAACPQAPAQRASSHASRSWIARGRRKGSDVATKR